MSLKLQLPDVTDLKPRISVVGVGGAGGNAINNMITAGVDGVEFIAANTDAQALAASNAEHRLQLGIDLTEGLGAGSKPEIGEAAAEEVLDEIRSQLSGSHMVFVAAGMGGGTGTGAASVIARVAQDLGILTVGIVTKPFHFEGNRRMRVAEAGLAALANHVDTLIVIPNQNLFRIANEKTTFAEAFVLADQVLHAGISCITDLIVREGLINLDFADVRAIMLNMGAAMMGTGLASGDRRAVEAAESAIANPLLDEISMRGAKGLLVSISGSREMTLYEVDEAASRVREEADPDANIIVGATFDDTLKNSIRVSIVASGLASAGVKAKTSMPGKSPFGHGRARAAKLESEAGNVAQRLSDAIRGAGGTTTRRGQPVDQAAPASTADQPIDPDEVTIELGPPTLISPARAPIQGAQSNDSRRGGGSHDPHFSPRTPAQLQRKPSRLPEVQDFPAVGQKDYRAKKDGSGQETNVPKKRVRLFDRLTGRAGLDPTKLNPLPNPRGPTDRDPAGTRPQAQQLPNSERAMDLDEGDLNELPATAPKFFKRR